ncbi:MAG: FtsX-like permease family protein [Azonexus sp.]
MWCLAWRMLGRELRSGELRLLFMALVVAVAAVTAVGFFADRVRLALELQAQQLMGGDLVLTADHPWSPEITQEAAKRGLQLAETLSFPSMVMGAAQPQLVDIKAVSSAYPLRGKLSAALQANETGQPVNAGPQPGSVWLDERLSGALQIVPGGRVGIGEITLPVSAILTLEPDRGINFFALAPRLMMHLDDIPGSGLVQAGSRVTYRLLLAGEADQIKGFRNWVNSRLGRGERLEDPSNARPEIRNALDRAQHFLGLATLLTVILSAVAAALAARRYMQRHLDACAVMRCFGLTQGGLVRLHAALFICLCILSALLGCLIGFAAHFVLITWLAKLLALQLPMPGWLPLGQGAIVAFVLLFGFAFPPLLQLSKVPTLRVLRRELGAPQASLLGGYFIGLLMLGGLILLVAGDLRLGGMAAAGFTLAALVFWGLARLAVNLLAGVRQLGGFGWRQGLANLGRHLSASTLQIAALAIGLMAILLMTVTRAELVSAWQKAAPANAPNRFIINIQPEQRQPMAKALDTAGIAAELSPMIRGRLLRIGDRSVSAADFPDDERAQRLIDREFNLSWRSAMPPGNRLSEGAWFKPDDAGHGLASVEEGLAKTLGIKLGDSLTFTISGKETQVRVSSLRKLEWDSMRVNFFVLMPPGVIDDAPASYITSFHLPADKAELGRDLVARFPNVTLIDVDMVLKQIQTVMEQVSSAVLFIFVFTLLAGGVVLYSALMTAFDERRYELSVMRALGAQRRQLRQSLLTELLVVGAIAGLIAAFGASALGQLLARQIFQMELPLNLWLPLQAAIVGAGLAVSVGWLAIRQLLRAPPLLALRAGA